MFEISKLLTDKNNHIFSLSHVFYVAKEIQRVIVDFSVQVSPVGARLESLLYEVSGLSEVDDLLRSVHMSRRRPVKKTHPPIRIGNSYCC